MNKSTAWGLASVSPGARRLAEQAARSAGLTLEEWLNRAIAEQADENPAAGRERPKLRSGGASARELQERLRASAGAAERLATLGNLPAARTVAIAAPLSDSASVDQTQYRPADPSGGAGSAIPARKAVDVTASPEGSHARFRKTDAKSDSTGLRDGRPRESLTEARAFRNLDADPGAFDLQSAVSQIASRRLALDAHLAHDGLESPPRKLESLPAEEESELRGRPVDTSAGAATESSTASEDSLRLGLHDLSGKLEALRRQWSGGRVSERDVASLQDQIDDVKRNLTDLAPRDSVAALESSLGILKQRVSALGRKESAEPVPIVQLDNIADQLREALGACDPRSVAADLERRIESVGARIDGLADALVRPDAVEVIRRQMQEVHDLLLSAARRSIPMERLEAQISSLVDRVERLTANPPSRSETELMTELLAALRRQTENPIVSSNLELIERRIGGIAARLEHEVAALSQARPDRDIFEAAALRIDASLQQSEVAATRVEASLNALGAK